MRKLKMYKNKTPGLLITFCGLDGCGKTTQINLLKEYFTKLNIDFYLTKQPTDAVRRSEIFRTYMDSPDHSSYEYRSLSLLAASDRLQHVSKVIRPELEKKKTVICDRYFYSCLANLRARGYKDDKWIYGVSESVIEPDLAFFIDVPVETAVSRVRSRPEEAERYIDMDLQYKLRREYIDICRRNNGILIPYGMTVEKCFETIKNEIDKVIEKWKTAE